MKQKIAIEPTLTPIKDYLSEKGYSVETINFHESSDLSNKRYDAIILTGQDINFMGMNDIKTKAVVIDAEGMTAEQVYHELQMRFE